jgi:hypothetical protein
MLKLVHRYLRRLVVWVQEPSEEELAFRARVLAAHVKKRDEDSIEWLLRGRIYRVPQKWCGLSRPEALKTLQDICFVAVDRNLTARNAIEACNRLCQANNLNLRDLIESGFVDWPFDHIEETQEQIA